MTWRIQRDNWNELNFPADKIELPWKTVSKDCSGRELSAHSKVANSVDPIGHSKGDPRVTKAERSVKQVQLFPGKIYGVVTKDTLYKMSMIKGT